MRKIRGARPRRGIYDGPGGRLAKLFDASLAIVAPGVALEKRRRRMKNEALLAYEAAKIDRLIPGEHARSADADILEGLDVMRARSRRLTRDDSFAASGATVYVDAVVGDGIMPQSAATRESTGATERQVAQWRKACEAYFRRWARDAAAAGDASFWDLQALVARTRKVDGEAFVHLVNTDGTPRVELIDADRICNPKFRPDDEHMRGGVEIDAQGRAIRYHVTKTHPDNGLSVLSSADGWVTVPAREGDISMMQHVLRRERPGQTRGVPDLVPGMTALEHLHHYLQSEVIAARASSNYAMFIRRQTSTTDEGIMPVQPTEGEREYHETLEPGTITYLNDGEEPIPFNPNRPGGAFDPFVTRLLRAVAAGQGMSYERIARHWGGMNYSSMRGQLKEEQRGFDRDRRLLNRQFNDPWWINVIRHGLATGELEAPPRFLDNEAAWLAVQWIAPAYGWVDPTKEIDAATKAIEANLSTPYHEAMRAGLDPEEILEMRARYYQHAANLEEEHGLAPGSLTGGKAVRQVVEPEPDGSSEGSDGGDLDPAKLKAQLDAIGIAMRSGLITPQQADEERARAQLGMPPMSREVEEAWKKEPTRRPVTLAKVADELDDGTEDGDGQEGEEQVPTGDDDGDDDGAEDGSDDDGDVDEEDASE